MVYHHTLQLCRTGHDNVTHTGMTTLACILSELFPLDCLCCSALCFEYCQDCYHETTRFCRRGHDKVLRIKNMAALMFILPVPPPPPLPPTPSPPPNPLPTPHPPPTPLQKYIFFSWIWILVCVIKHLLESSKLDL